MTKFSRTESDKGVLRPSLFIIVMDEILKTGNNHGTKAIVMDYMKLHSIIKNELM